jgi:hypothetical protein
VLCRRAASEGRAELNSADLAHNPEVAGSKPLSSTSRADFELGTAPSRLRTATPSHRVACRAARKRFSSRLLYLAVNLHCQCDLAVPQGLRGDPGMHVEGDQERGAGTPVLWTLM